MRNLSSLCRTTIPILLLGSLAACGDSNKSSDANSSGKEPQQHAPDTEEMGPLARALAERAAASAAKIPPEAMAVFKKAADELVAAKPLSSTKGVGDAAPTFTLPDANGNAFSLADSLKKGPVVLSFYRGKW